MPGKNQQAKSKFIWPIVWLLGMAIITTWSIYRHLPIIEQEIFKSAQTALDSANIPDITLTVDGRHATLTGNIVNAALKEQLVNVVADAEGIRSVTDQLTVVISDEAALSESTPSEVTPTIVPDEQATPNTTTAQLVNEADEQPRILEEPAEDTGVAIDNATSISDAQGAMATNDLPELKVEVNDGAMMLSGQISNQDSLFELIRTAMIAFNASYVVNNVQVNELTAKADWLPAVNRFLPSMEPLSNASIDIVESQIMVSGEAANEDEHDQVIDQALSQLSNLSLVERISINEDTIQAESNVVEAEISAKTTVESSEELENQEVDTEITASNEASPEEEIKYAKAIDINNENVGTELVTSASNNNTINIAEVIAEAAVDTPQETTTADVPQSIDPTDPNIQRQDLKMALQSIDTTKLLFQSSSDVLTEDSKAVLTNIANLFSQYPQVSIDIDGHTDASGDSTSNLKLSQLRATTVLKFLVNQGIEEERLNANGLGDGVPIADNSTPAGRRLNRRIEFNF